MKPQKVLLAMAVLSFALSSATGCGSADQRDVKPTGATLTETPKFPVSSNGQTYSNVNGVAEGVLGAIQGTYEGTVFRRDSMGVMRQQPFSLVISRVTVTGSSDQYLFGQFTSNGQLGNVFFNEAFGYGLNGLYNSYSIVTPAFRINAGSDVSALADYDVSFELVLMMTGDGRVDASRSGIFIKECPFAQYSGCGSISDDAGFVNNAFTKR